jgi:hypothetical protein
MDALEVQRRPAMKKSTTSTKQSTSKKQSPRRSKTIRQQKPITIGMDLGAATVREAVIGTLKQ